MNTPGSITCPVRAAAERKPESVAISSSGKVITYGELDGIVGGTSEILERNLSGERVGISLEKSAAHIALVFALIRTGTVAVEVSTRIPPAEVPAMLLRAGCSALVTEDPALRTAAETHGIDVLTVEELVVAEPAPAGEAEIPVSRPATIIFTSGSSGRPKAALHTFGNHYASAVGSARNIPLAPCDVWLHSLPLYHVGGLSILFRCALAGATIALPEPGETIAESIRRSGATHVSLVATQLRRLLDEGAELSGVEAILLGGSGIPESLLDRAHELGLPVHTSYGLTEMASQVTTTAPGASRDELRTSGRTLPGRELRISDEGEVLVRGETLFAGYVEGGGIASPLDADGWFHTKDLGSLDGDGLLTVKGRADNLFVSGGENVQPEEIEAALRRIDGIEEAVVVPVPDEEFGERPVSFVRGEVPSDVTTRLRQTLPGFEVPVAFYGWPDDAPGGMKTDRRFFHERASSLRSNGERTPLD